MCETRRGGLGGNHITSPPQRRILTTRAYGLTVIIHNIYRGYCALHTIAYNVPGDNNIMWKQSFLVVVFFFFYHGLFLKAKRVAPAGDDRRRRYRGKRACYDGVRRSLWFIRITRLCLLRDCTTINAYVHCYGASRRTDSKCARLGVYATRRVHGSTYHLSKESIKKITQCSQLHRNTLMRMYYIHLYLRVKLLFLEQHGSAWNCGILMPLMVVTLSPSGKRKRRAFKYTVALNARSCHPDNIICIMYVQNIYISCTEQLIGLIIIHVLMRLFVGVSKSYTCL